jgi:hypothetical protein
MATKDYNLPYQTFNSLYPQELKNPMSESLFNNLFNRFMTRDESVPLYGYVGKQPVTDSGAPAVPQLNSEREVNSLIPVITFMVGSETYTFTVQDLVRKAEVLGISKDQSSWLYSQGNNYAPPIDLNKFTNFFNYYWVAQAGQENVDLTWNETLAPEYFVIARPAPGDLNKVNARVATTTNTVLTGTGFYQQTWTVHFDTPTTGTVTANGALGAYLPVTQNFTLTSNNQVIDFTVSDGTNTVTLLTFNVVRDAIFDENGDPAGSESFAAGDEFLIDAPFLSTAVGITFTGSTGVKGKVNNVRTLNVYQTIDGVLLQAGDRILVKDNTGAENGIYVVQAQGWTRAVDFDVSTWMVNDVVFVVNGTLGGGQQYVSSGSAGAWSWTANGLTFSNTNDWQEGNFWLSSEDVASGPYDLSKVFQATRPIIEVQADIELNNHVDSTGNPAPPTGIFYGQRKYDFDQLPLFNLYRYDGTPAKLATSIFFYVEDATAAVDGQLQRRVKLTTTDSADFIFDHGMVDESGELLFFKDGTDLKTIWHPGYQAASVVETTFVGNGDGALTVTATDPTQVQQIWTLTATSPTTFKVVGSKTSELPTTPTDLTVINAGTPYSNGLFDATITVGATPFTAGDVFTFSIGGEETVRYVFTADDGTLVDIFGGPNADTENKGAWLVPRMFYNNVAADNSNEVPEGTMYSHFRGIIANQIPGGTENRAFGGSIKLWSELQNLLASLLMQRDMTPLSMIDGAKVQYEVGLNTISDLFFTHFVNYLGEVEVVTDAASTDRLLDYLLTQRVQDQDVKTVLYDTTAAVPGFPLTAPQLGISPRLTPGLVFDDELGLTLLRHHDGHMSPPYTDSLDLRDQLLSPNTMVKRSDNAVTAAVGSYTTTPPSLPYKGLLWFYPLGYGKVDYRVYNVVSDLSAPSNPATGDLWYSRPTNVLYVWNGTLWAVESNQLLPWTSFSFGSTLNDVLINLEQRLYDGCPPTHHTYFSQADVETALSSDLAPALERELAQWASTNGYDPTAPDYVSTDPFTWNYSGLTVGQTAPLTTSTVPARWYNLLEAHQGTVTGVIPTSRPNIEPWLLVGQATKPVNWDSMWAAPVSPDQVANPINGFTNGGAVAVVTTSPAAFNGLVTIDGYTLVAGDLILITGETIQASNGVWTASSAGWTRNMSASLALKQTFTVTKGYEYSGTVWYVSTAPASIGTDPVVVQQARYWSQAMWSAIAAARPTLKLSVDVTRDMLIPPYVSTVVSSSVNAVTNTLPPTPAASYTFGESSPVETVWTRTIDYRYSLASALFVTDPLTWLRELWGFEWVTVDGIRYDGFDVSMPGHPRFRLHGDPVAAIVRTQPLSVDLITAPTDFTLSIVHDAYDANHKQVFSIYDVNGVYLGTAEEGTATSLAVDGYVITNLLMEDEGRPFRQGDTYTLTGTADGATISMVATPATYYQFRGFGQVFTQALRGFSVDTSAGYAISAYRGWEVNLGYRAGGLVETNDLLVFTDSEVLPESAYELRVKRSPYAADTWAQALRVSVVQLGSYVLSSTGAPIATNDASDWVFRIDGYNSRHLDISYYTYSSNNEVTFKALASAHTDRTWYQPTEITGTVDAQLPLIITGLQNVVDVIYGYTDKLISEGWIFNLSSQNNIDQETGRNRTWQLEIEKLVDRVYAGINLGDGVVMNPFMDHVWIELNQGLLSPFADTALFDVDADPAVYDTLGVKLKTEDLIVMRSNGRAEIWADAPMFGVHAQFDEYEHIFVLANEVNPSTGEGLIYDPFTGARIITLRFNGRKQATATLRPEYGGHYLVGDEVKRNLQASTDMVQGFYDPNKVYEDELSTTHALALLGFTPKDYMADLDLTNRTQFDFWRGLIQLKGTNASIQAFLNNDRFQDAKIDEYWAYKVAEYGDARQKIYPELKIDVDDCVQQFTKLVFDYTPPTAPATGSDFAAFTEVDMDDETRWFSIDDLNGPTTFTADELPTLSQNIDADYMATNGLTFPFQLTLPFIADWRVVDGANVTKLNETTYLVSDFTELTITGWGVSVGKFNPMKLFNYVANEKIDDIVFWHPATGQHTPNALESINIISKLDPARYNVSTLVEGNSNYDPLRPWGAKEVGRVWWDMTRLDYLPYYDKVIFPRVEDRLARWGTLADYAAVDVYEWVESSVSPADYAAQALIDAGDADLDSADKADGVVADAKYYVRDRIWLTRPIAWSYSGVPNGAAHMGGAFGSTDYNSTLYVEAGTSSLGDGLLWLESNTFLERGIVAGMRVGAWNLDPLTPEPLSELTVLSDFTKRLMVDNAGDEELFVMKSVTTSTDGAVAILTLDVTSYTPTIGGLEFLAEPVDTLQLTDNAGTITDLVDVSTFFRVVETETGDFQVISLRVDRGDANDVTPGDYFGATFTTYANQVFSYTVPNFGLRVNVKFMTAGTWNTVTMMEAIVQGLNDMIILHDQVSYQTVVAGSNLPTSLINDQDPTSGTYNGIGWRAWTVPTQQQLDADSRQPNSCWVPFVGPWPVDQVAFNTSITVIQNANFTFTLNDGTEVRSTMSTWSAWRVLADEIFHQVVADTSTVTFEVPDGTALSSISVYINGSAQLAGSYSLSGTTVTLSFVPPVGAEVHLIVRGYVPTTVELAFDPDVTDNVLIQQQYKVDYQHVEVPVRDENGSILSTIYYFWVKDRSSVAQGKKTSVKSMADMLTTGPSTYVTFHDALHQPDNGTSYSYNAIAVAGLNYVVAQDDTFKLRFTRDFTLRDDPHGMDLKDVHTEWTLLRPGQRAVIPAVLWTLLTSTSAGQDAVGNAVPSARRIAYDTRNGTATQFGFATDQALAPQDLVNATLQFTILNTRLVDDSGPTPVPDYITVLDFNESDSWFDTPEHARATMTTIWNGASAAQINELFFAAVEEICAANYTMTDLFKTSRLSVYSIKVVDPVPVAPSYE